MVVVDGVRLHCRFGSEPPQSLSFVFFFADVRSQ